MAVLLNSHQFRHLTVPVFATLPTSVPPEVNEHDMLGILLGSFLRSSRVPCPQPLWRRASRACNGPQHYMAALKPHEYSGEAPAIHASPSRENTYKARGLLPQRPVYIKRRCAFRAASNLCDSTSWNTSPRLDVFLVFSTASIKPLCARRMK